MRKTLSAVALAGLMFAGTAVPADAATAPVTGPIMTPRYWAQNCMRETLGLRGTELAAWHRWCAGIQPKRHGGAPSGSTTDLQAYLSWLRAVRCERYPATCPTVWKP